MGNDDVNVNSMVFGGNSPSTDKLLHCEIFVMDFDPFSEAVSLSKIPYSASFWNTPIDYFPDASRHHSKSPKFSEQPYHASNDILSSQETAIVDNCKSPTQSWVQHHKLLGSSVIRVFFSSPFGGMEEERAELTRVYFPELRALCEAVGLTFVPIDLRWGITEQDAQNALVLQLCLREIERSDIFIGFYGSRYGWHDTTRDELLMRNFEMVFETYPWISECTDKSITEIEFQAGFLRSPGEKGAAFFFRDLAFDEQRSKELERDGNVELSKKYRPESASAAIKRDSLRSSVQNIAMKHDVPCMNYSTPDSGARIIFEQLKRIIMPRLQIEREQHREKFIDPEAAQHDVFMQLKSSALCGNEHYLEDIDGFIKSSVQVPLIITGTNGVGKSGILAELIRSSRGSVGNEDESDNQSRKRDDIIFVYHFVGCSGSSTTLDNLLQRVTLQLAALANSTEDVRICSTPQLKAKLAVSLNKTATANPEKIIAIILDGLDELMDSQTICDLSWLPTTIPSNVAIVVSMGDDAPIQGGILDNFKQITVSPRTSKTVKQIIDIQLQTRGKDLSQEQKQTIIRHSACQIPLYLQVLLTELCAFGSFEHLDNKIHSCLQAENTEDLFIHVLQRLDEDFCDVRTGMGHEAVKAIMTYLLSARQGLSETEIMECLLLSHQSWSRLYFALENVLSIQSGLLCINRKQFIAAVERHYNLNPETKLHIQQQLSEYFYCLLKIVPGRRVMTELPWLLEQTQQWDRLRECITQPAIFQLLCEDISLGNYDLMRYWDVLGDSSSQIASAYMENLEETIHKAMNTRDYMVKDIIVAATRVGQYLAEAGHFRLAIRPFQQALRLKEKVYGSESWQLVDTLSDLGRLCFSQGDTSTSLLFYERAMSIAKTSLSQDDLTYVNVEVGYASVLKKRHKFSEALPLFEHALQVYRTTLSEEDPDVALVFHNIGDICAQKNEEEKAFEHYTAAHDIRQRVLGCIAGPMHPSTAATLSAMGSVLISQGNTAKAHECFQRALEIRQKVLGPRNAETAETIGKLALVMSVNGHFEDAADKYTEALEMLEMEFGEDHPVLCEYLDRLGELAQEMEQGSDALSFYMRSLAIKEKSLGENSAELCDTLYNIAHLSLETDNIRRAYSTMERLYAIALESFGSDAPLTKDTEEKLQMLSELKL
eukprot:gene8204-808_t